MYGPYLSAIVGGRALTPPIRRRLGGPLPRQLADRPRTPLLTSGLAVPDFGMLLMRAATICGINSPFDELFPI